MLYSILLIVHITSGTAALIGMTGAITAKVVVNHHKIHIFFGRLFIIGMLMVFLTTIPMTILRPNLFLLLIGIFSFYLAWNGWRMALNRNGKAQFSDIIGNIIMGCTSLMMIGWGCFILASGDGNGITLILFGCIGGAFALQNIRRYTRGPVKGSERIRAHLSAMMGASIAAITAFLVVNIQTDPVWVAWIAPTLAVTPFIVYMNRRVYHGRQDSDLNKFIS